MSRGEHKIVVRCQQHQVVTNAELRDHGVDRADLHTGAAAAIAQLRSIDVIHPVRSKQREGRKTVNDVLSRLRARKPLQQFLQDEACNYDCFTAVESVAQYAYLGSG